MRTAILFLCMLLSGCSGSSANSRHSADSAGPGPWKALFDGRTLDGWEPSPFPAAGPVRVKNGVILLEQGEASTGVRRTGPVPRMNYELEVEARRVRGGDFFCGLTFPVGPDACSLIVGGWGGSLVGISCIDRYDASENETTRTMTLSTGRWYFVRVRVTAGRIESWIRREDEPEEKVVDVATAGRKISVRGDITESLPMGVAAWRTTAEIRAVRVRDLPEGPPGGDSPPRHQDTKTR